MILPFHFPLLFLGPSPFYFPLIAIVDRISFPFTRPPRNGCAALWRSFHYSRPITDAHLIGRSVFGITITACYEWKAAAIARLEITTSSQIALLSPGSVYVRGRLIIAYLITSNTLF